MPHSELFSFLEIFPFSSLYTGKKRKAMEIQWKKAHTSLPLNAALNFLFFLNIFSSSLSFFLAFLFFSDILFSFGISLLTFALFLLIGFRLPLFMANRYSSLIESDLPLALRAISLHLKIKLPFEQSLLHVANSNYASSQLFKHALSSIYSGQSVPSSLSQIASSTTSLPFSRAIHSLTLIYEEGTPPATLDSLADELISRQLSFLRLQSSRIAMIGLFFVASSSLLPAFFLILNIAAGPLLGFSTSEFSIFLFYIFALPCINFLILSIMFASAPSLKNAFRQKAIEKETKKLLSSSPFPSLSSPQLLLFSIILFLIGFLFSSLLSFHTFSPLIALLFASLPSLLLTYYEGKVLSHLSSLESELPNILLAGASSPRFSLETMLSYASKSSSPSLSLQSTHALRQLNAGTNPMQVLSQWSFSTPSIMLSRALILLSIGYQTGSNLQKALRASAEDLMSNFNLIRERASLLSMQNYTLITATALLVPAILAISLSFSTQISEIQLPSSSLLSATEISEPNSPLLSPPNTKNLISAASTAIPIYLFLNSLLAAFFISLSSGTREKFIPYAIFLTLISQLVFLLITQGWIGI
ncbi:MAG: type II secretion system F family protein [Candidatus Micrarchaeota archaeon]